MVRLHCRSLASIAACLLHGAAFAPTLAASDVDGLVADAIAAAVREHLHSAADVQVTDVRTNVTEAQRLRAEPEPGARAGRTVRFTLWSGPARVGTATARVDVIAAAVVAVQPIARDETVEDGAVASVEQPLSGVLLRRLPVMEDVTGARARRDIAAGDVITSAVVYVPPAVRSGDRVTVTVRMGAVEAEGVGRASGSGYVGDVIRVSAWGGRELQPARITAVGAVEIVP